MNNEYECRYLFDEPITLTLAQLIIIGSELANDELQIK